MKSRESFFSISKPLIIENLRRFWAIPALSFLIYFLSGVFPILMTYSHLNDLSSYIRMSLYNEQPFYLIAHFAFPVIAAVVIFRYLQGISSVSVMHSMPFTRAKLYNSGFISGLILIITPILVNGLILLAISKPVYNTYTNSAGIRVPDGVNLFARAEVLNWIWVSVLVVMVVYTVSIFSGIVTGNALAHLAASVWFNFLIPALYGVFIAYFANFLYGFNTRGSFEEFGLGISPILNLFQCEGHFSIHSTIYYILSALVLYGISGYLYKKRQLERATDTLVFGLLEPIICYLVAFFGMTVLGFYFQVLGESEMYLYAGFAAGTVIFFIIGQMIVKKTPRIYNAKSLKSFGIYALIAVLFLLGLNFDITGFERRVPDTKDVSGFTLTGDFDRLDPGYYFNSDSTTIFNNGVELLYHDPDNIKALTELHKQLIEEKEHLEDLRDVYSRSMKIAYNPDSLFPLTRKYEIDYATLKDSSQFKQIYESEEYRNYFAPDNLNYVKLNIIEVSANTPLAEPLELKNKKEVEEFMDCLNRDFKSQSFEDTISLHHEYATAEIYTKYQSKNPNIKGQLIDGHISYRITDGYKNTIQWLEANGYGDRFNPKAADVEYIEIYHYVDNGDEDGASEAEYRPDVSLEKVNEQEILKVTDPVEIQNLLDSYETDNINYKDYYYGTIFYKWNEDTNPNYKPGYYGDDYAYEEKMGYTKDADRMASMQIYFNEGNIPDYVLDYFN